MTSFSGPQVGELDGTQVSHRASAPANQQFAIGAEPSGADPLAMWRAGNNGEIELACRHAVRQRGAVGFHHRNPDVGKLGDEVCQGRREHTPCEGRHQPDTDFAADPGGENVHFPRHLIELAKNTYRKIVEAPAGKRRCDSPGRPIEKLETDLFLEILVEHREAGLGGIQTLGGLGKRPLLIDPHEGPQLPDIEHFRYHTC